MKLGNLYKIEGNYRFCTIFYFGWDNTILVLNVLSIIFENINKYI